MRHYLFVPALLLTLQLSAQRYIWSPDSALLADPNYAMNRYQDILRYHDPIMYLVFPVVEPVVDRKVPLQDGEAQNGYWPEANFAYRFAAYKGKYYSPRFWQRTRFTLDVGLTSRLTRDDSAPLLPMNNQFGLGLDFLLSPLGGLSSPNATLWWTTLQLHHYSNGQADSFFIHNSVQRNNYTGGDFSTNYFRGLLTVSGNPQQKNSVSFTAGYQQDIDLGGPLARSKELPHYYGDSRLLFQFQFTKKPTLITMNYLNRGAAEDAVVKVDVRRQLQYRTELEYILGDLSQFPGDNKWRVGWHNYLTYMPSVTNEVGFILHTYLGRDYLNIRFDDVVFIGSAGLFVKFNAR